MPQSPESWALIISILAIGISIIIWLKSHNIDRSRRDDEKRDQKSAVLKAYLERHQASMGKIVIDNIGQSEARDVQVILDGTPILKHKSILDPTKSHPIIGPNSQVVYKINVAKDLPPPNHIELSWDDDH
ncbi:MAG: hypothetical protein WD607_10245, partial [Candidatus Paceibacterota bacterium]